jgi:hypothetical protein
MEERIGSSNIQVEHRDALIRLRAMIEDDLAYARGGVCAPDSAGADGII